MYIDSTVNCLTVCVGVEDVTNNLTILIRSVCDHEMLLSSDVGQTSHENSTRETIKVLRVVAINITLVPNLELFTVLVHSLDYKIEV